MTFDGPNSTRVEIDPSLVTHVATTEDPNIVAVYYTAVDNAYQFGREHVRGNLAAVRAALGLPPPPDPSAFVKGPPPPAVAR